LARPSGRRPTRRGAGRTRAWRDCSQRDCEPGRIGSGRGVDRARIRLAEDRRPFDSGRRSSSRRPSGGHSLSLTAASRRGAGRAEAGRCLSGERGERTGHPSLAVAGARCAGRRWRAFLFLVDDEPDTARSARRNGAGTCDTRAVGRRAGPIPASCSSAGGARARPPASALGCLANACASTSGVGATSCPYPSDGSAGYGSAAAGASGDTRSIGRRASDSAANFATDRTGACNPGSCGSRNG
jgi:hypothetical protein